MIATSLEFGKSPSLASLYRRALFKRGPGLPAGGQLPPIAASLKAVRIDPAELNAFTQVCGFVPSKDLPVIYPHRLAFPLHMAMMLTDTFPFPLLGLVHIGNRITQYRPIGAHESLDIHCALGDVQPADKGLVLSVRTRITAAGELLWESESRALKRLASSASNEKKPTRQLEPFKADEKIFWEIPSNMGRRYARVSGDRNPIHLYPLTAKLFGFKRHIIHGMWTKARALAQLQPQLPSDPYHIDVSFKLPIFLPAKVLFETRSEGALREFRVMDKTGEKPHLSGSIKPL